MKRDTFEKAQKVYEKAQEGDEKAQGKRGGGLEEYAVQLGKSRTMISHFRAAAEVYIQLRVTLHEVEYLVDKPNHLYELHAAPPEIWPQLAEYARSIGKARNTVSELRTAAAVYIELRRSSDEVAHFIIDRHKHLLALHAAPPETWLGARADSECHGSGATDNL
jgi:hypothetical protein